MEYSAGDDPSLVIAWSGLMHDTDSNKYRCTSLGCKVNICAGPAGACDRWRLAGDSKSCSASRAAEALKASWRMLSDGLFCLFFLATFSFKALTCQRAFVLQSNIKPLLRHRHAGGTEHDRQHPLLLSARLWMFTVLHHAKSTRHAVRVSAAATLASAFSRPSLTLFRNVVKDFLLWFPTVSTSSVKVF